MINRVLFWRRRYFIGILLLLGVLLGIGIFSRGKKVEKNDAVSIDSVIEAYPRLYSQHRFREWGGLFDPDAIIYYAGNKKRWSMSIQKFIPLQARIAEGHSVFTERWENFEKYIFGNCAVARADYVLQADQVETRGYDVLMLVKGDQGWRIAALTFEALSTKQIK